MIIDRLVTLLDFKVDDAALKKYKANLLKISQLTNKLGIRSADKLRKVSESVGGVSRALAANKKSILSNITSIRSLQASYQNAVATGSSKKVRVAIFKELLKRKRLLKTLLEERDVIKTNRRAKISSAKASINAARRQAVATAEVNNQLLKQKLLWKAIGKQSYKALTGMLRRLSRTASVLIRFRNLLGVTIATAIGLNAVGQVITTGAEFEKNRAMLRRFAIDPDSPQATAPGNEIIREGIAKKNEQFIEELAIKTPLNIAEVTAAFVDMKQRGMDPLDGTLKALIDTNAAYGGGAEELKLELLQLGQAWAKNKLQGQDARVLLEKRLPLLKALVKITGKNTESIYKEIEAGKINRQVLKDSLLLMGEWSAEAAEMAALRFDGLMNKLGEFKTIFLRDIGDAGFFASVKSILMEITTALAEMRKSGELKKIAKDVSDFLVKNLKELWSWLKKTFTAFREGTHWTQRFSKAVGGLGNLLKILIAIGVTAWLSPIVVAVVFLTKAFLLMAGSFRPLVLAATATYGAFKLITNNWQWIKDNYFIVAAGITAVATALLFFARAAVFRTITQVVVAFVDALGAARAFGAFLMANPWVAVISLVSAAVVALALNWDKATEALSGYVKKFDSILRYTGLPQLGEFIGETIAERTAFNNAVAANPLTSEQAEALLNGTLNMNDFIASRPTSGIRLTPPVPDSAYNNGRGKVTNNVDIVVNSTNADPEQVANKVGEHFEASTLQRNETSPVHY